MAAGNSMIEFGAVEGQPPSSNYPTFSTRNNHGVLEFDATNDEAIYFEGVLPRHYSGNGLTVDLHWAGKTATSGTCRWQVAFEALVSQDIDSDGFATANSAGGSANGTSGIPTVTSIAFANGSEIDSLAAGGSFRIKVNRDADGTTGTDDMSGDAQLIAVHVYETP